MGEALLARAPADELRGHGPKPAASPAVNWPTTAPINRPVNPFWVAKRGHTKQGFPAVPLPQATAPLKLTAICGAPAQRGGRRGGHELRRGEERLVAEPRRTGPSGRRGALGPAPPRQRIFDDQQAAGGDRRPITRQVRENLPPACAGQHIAQALDGGVAELISNRRGSSSPRRAARSAARTAAPLLRRRHPHRPRHWQRTARPPRACARRARCSPTGGPARSNARASDDRPTCACRMPVWRLTKRRRCCASVGKGAHAARHARCAP